MSKLVVRTKTAGPALVTSPMDQHPSEVPAGSTALLADHSAKVVPDGKAGYLEIGGPEGLEPTRFGDWERKGRCIDF